MRRVFVCAFAVLLCLPASATAADEVQLKNGDRLTGDVVALAGGRLTFKTGYGELVIPWSEVATVRLDAPMLVTVAGAAPRLTSLEGIPVDTITALAIEQPAVVVSGSANAGFLNAGGNTHVDSLRLDGQVTARRRMDRVATSAVVNHAEDDGRRTARNATGTFNYDRFITERLFANGNAIFTNDTFRGLDLRSALGAGLGYEAVKTPRSTVSFEGGLGYVRENFVETPTSSYAAAREAIRLTAFLVPNQVQAFHGHDGYFGLTGEDNLFFRMQNGVRLTLPRGLVSTFQIDLDYDKSPAPGRKTTDRTTSLTFGYRF